jgi:hypothetical protein
LLPCGLNIFRLFSWLAEGFTVYVHYLIPELRRKIATHPTGKSNEKYVLKQISRAFDQHWESVISPHKNIKPSTEKPTRI